jgi:hypothetical protein
VLEELIVAENQGHRRLGGAIRIVTNKGETVAGTASPLPDAPAWQFIPDRDWLPGRYRIEVRTEVEDVSGNSVQSAFDAIAGRSASLRDEQLLLSFDTEVAAVGKNVPRAAVDRWGRSQPA